MLRGVWIYSACAGCRYVYTWHDREDTQTCQGSGRGSGSWCASRPCRTACTCEGCSRLAPGQRSAACARLLNLQHQHKTSHFQLLASQHELRGEPLGRRRLVSFSFPLSFFYFFFFILFFHRVILITLLLLLCRFRAAFAFCSILLGYVSRFKLAFLFLEWLFSRVAGSLDTWIGIRLCGSQRSRGFQDPRSSNPSEQNCEHRSRVGSLNLWILEFLESEISRSSSPRILRHSIFGILNLQILGFSNPRILRSPRSWVPGIRRTFNSSQMRTRSLCILGSSDPDLTLINIARSSSLNFLVAFASLSLYISFHSLKSPPILLINVYILFIYVIYPACALILIARDRQNKIRTFNWMYE